MTAAQVANLLTTGEEGLVYLVVPEDIYSAAAAAIREDLRTAVDDVSNYWPLVTWKGTMLRREGNFLRGT